MQELKTYSISQYCTSIQRLLKQRVPDVWVHGVISQLNIRGRLVYMQIAEFAEDDSRPVSTLSLYMYASEFEEMNERLSREVQPFKLDIDLKVSLYLEADFYVPLGKFQARIKDIDPNFTIGELAITRKKIIARLQSEGLLDRNKKHVLSPIPLRVGLITAEGSAAHNDFLDVLNSSRYAFVIHLRSAKMQGQETESTVAAALRSLAALDLDVVCICRGGGSKTDLVYFDSELLCREIAHYPIPVITGIGHQIDSTLVDLVAWDNRITPTACARFLVEQLDTEWERLLDAKTWLNRSWEMMHQIQNEAVYTVGYTILNRVPQLLKFEREKVKRHTIGLLRGPHKVFFQHRLTFETVKSSIWQTWAHRYQRANAHIRETMSRLEYRTQDTLKLQAQKMSMAVDALRKRWRSHVELQNSEIKNKEKLVRSFDPKRTLELGYSISRVQKKGEKSSVADFSALNEGDILITEFKDGSVFSKITAKEV